MSSIIAAAVVAAAGVSAPAEPAAGAGPAAEAPELVKKKDRLVCRSVRTTSTRMPSRVCRTQEQWAENRETAKRRAELMQQRDTNFPSMDPEGAEPLARPQ